MSYTYTYNNNQRILLNSLLFDVHLLTNSLKINKSLCNYNCIIQVNQYYKEKNTYSFRLQIKLKYQKPQHKNWPYIRMCNIYILSNSKKYCTNYKHSNDTTHIFFCLDDIFSTICYLPLDISYATVSNFIHIFLKNVMYEKYKFSIFYYPNYPFNVNYKHQHPKLALEISKNNFHLKKEMS